MIRILHILPGNMNMGGIEKYLMNVYRNIDKNIVQFDFIVHSENKNYFEEEIISMGGKIYRMPVKSKNIVKYYKKLKKFLLKHDEYETVHIHTTYSYSCVEALAAKKAKKKNVIIHSHNSNAILKRKIIHYILKRKQCCYGDYYIACSKDAAKWMYTSKIINTNKYMIWRNSIDTSKFVFNSNVRKNLRKKYNISEDTIVIGSVGRISYQKNPERIVDIFKKIIDKNNNVCLFMIGTGELEEKILKMIEEYGLINKFYHINNVSNVNEYMQMFDLFLFPSRYEGLGIVLIEAQAAGLKCFASSNVPQEVKITDLVTYINLNESDDYWANQLLKSMPYNRVDMSKEIKKAKYDNHENIKKIIEFYQKINNKKGE